MVAYMGQTRRVGVRTTGRTSPGDVILLGFFCREEKKSTFFFCGKKKDCSQPTWHGMAFFVRAQRNGPPRQEKNFTESASELAHTTGPLLIASQISNCCDRLPRTYEGGTDPKEIERELFVGWSRGR
jgi:hypothetical protein